MIHFGEIVAEVLQLKEIALIDAAAYADISLEKLKLMLKRSEWTTEEVKKFSVALNHDFGKYLSPWEIEINALAGFQDANFYVSYNPETDGDKLDQVNIVLRRLCAEFGLLCQ